MSVMINAEHQDLSAQTQLKIELALKKLTDYLNESSPVRVFIKRAKNRFEMVAAIHVMNQDRTYRAEGNDLIALAKSAGSHLLTSAVALKKKKIIQRRSRNARVA